MTHQAPPSKLRQRQHAQAAVAEQSVQIGRVVFAAALSAVALTAFLFPRLAGAAESFADLADRLLPAVVNISTEQEIRGGGPVPDDFLDRFRGSPDGEPRRATSLGSGFIIDGEEAIVITNNHVIEDADEISVILQDETTFIAEVVGTDAATDIAVLRIDTQGRTLPEVPWGDSDALRVGDWVLAIGNPLGLGGTVTAGIVSARGRNIDSGPYDDYIQTDASINRGNSGGPLFNMAGDVVGINTAIFSQTGGSIGIGFSIPSNQAFRIVDQIRTFGSTRRGWLGVSIQDVTDDIADSLGMDGTYGALISTVHPDGPAEAAGFQAGDVIIEFNGSRVDDQRSLLRLVANAPVDETVDVEVWRNGEAVALSPTLGQREKVDLAALSGGSNRDSSDGGGLDELDSLGLEIGPLSDSLIDRFDLQSDEGGAVIVGIDPDSDAREKNLEEGDVILEVNQTAVSSPGDVMEQVEEARDAGRSSVLLKILRGDRRIFVAVKFNR